MLTLLLTAGMILAITLQSLYDLLQEPEFWGLVLGAVITPLVTDIAKQPGFSQAKRRALGIVTSLIVGGVTTAAAGNFFSGDLLTTILIVYGASQVAYHNLWKPTGVSEAVADATVLHPSTN